MSERTCLVLATGGPGLALANHLAGWTVRIFDDPGIFVAHLRADRPDLAVVTSPPARTIDLARVETERRRWPGLPVVLLDPPDRVAERLDALSRGFDDALPTSIEPDELAGRLVRLAARGPGQRPAARRVAITPSYELDLLSRELLRNGRRIPLRPKEFALLSELAREPGVVRDRRDLLDRIWGPGTAASSGTLNVHIRRLRMKIEPSPDHPAHLITVRGVGYRLDRSTVVIQR